MIMCSAYFARLSNRKVGKTMVNGNRFTTMATYVCYFLLVQILFQCVVAGTNPSSIPIPDMYTTLNNPKPITLSLPTFIRNETLIDSYYDSNNHTNGVLFFPLIGIGVGNLQYDKIIEMINGTLYQTLLAQTRTPLTTVPNDIQKQPHVIACRFLIDTAHASKNERLIRQGIDAAVDSFATFTNSNMKNNEKNQIVVHIHVHIITKVWYTHLGYERTKISVQESLNDLWTSGRNNRLRPPTSSTNSMTERELSTNNLRTTNSTNSEIVTQVNHQNGTNDSKNNIVISLVHIHVHMLLHWPRCRTDIGWMDCIGEEERLDETIKRVGTNPYTNPNAFLESWKALEDIYLRGSRSSNNNHNNTTHNTDDDVTDTIHDDDGTYLDASIRTRINLESIGVSNFDSKDLQDVIQMARIKPHILQHNVWVYLFDRHLLQLCNQHLIHFQAYNVMNGIVAYNNQQKSPYACNALERVGKQLLILVPRKPATGATTTTSTDAVSVAQVVMSWLVHQNVSIIPRTSSLKRWYTENSPMSLEPLVQAWRSTGVINAVTELDGIVQKSIHALLQGHDLEPVRAIFQYKFSYNVNSNNNNTFRESVPATVATTPMATLTESSYVWDLYWKDPTTNDEVLLTTLSLVPSSLTKNETFYTTYSHPGHIFIAKRRRQDKTDHDNVILQQFEISAEYGEEQVFQLHNDESYIYHTNSTTKTNSVKYDYSENKNHGTNDGEEDQGDYDDEYVDDDEGDDESEVVDTVEINEEEEDEEEL